MPLINPKLTDRQLEAYRQQRTENPQAFTRLKSFLQHPAALADDMQRQLASPPADAAEKKAQDELRAIVDFARTPTGRPIALQQFRGFAASVVDRAQPRQVMGELGFRITSKQAAALAPFLRDEAHAQRALFTAVADTLDANLGLDAGVALWAMFSDFATHQAAAPTHDGIVEKAYSDVWRSS